MDKLQKNSPMKNLSGFTLIELMITIVIAGILLAVGVPSFNAFAANNRLTTQVNSFVTAVNFTRSEAIKRSSSVTICKSNTGTSCAGNWSDGWVVFDDINNNGAINAGDTIILVHGALQNDNTLISSANRISYSSQGLAPGFNNTFTLCDNRGATKAKAIITSNTGRVRLAIDSNADGTVEDGSGSNITCP